MIHTIKKADSKILFLNDNNLSNHVNKYEYVFVITHIRIEKLIIDSILFDFEYKAIIINVRL